MEEKKPTVSRKVLQMRKRAKHKKPEFLRSESWRYDKMSESWRRPRGLDHKMRRKIKGWPPMVSTGYKGPKIARGLHPSGLREVLVHNVDELSTVDATVQAARIAHTVGNKKRALILSKAKEKKIIVLNPGVEEAPAEGEQPEEGEEPVAEAEESKEKKPEKRKRSFLGRTQKPQKKPTRKPKKTEEKAETSKGDEE